MSSLRARRVVLTRAEHQAGDLRTLLHERGADILDAPVIAILPPLDWAPVDAALRRLDEVDWIVFTSANAVASVWDRLARLELTLPGRIRLAAVGPATARALGARGARAPVIPTVALGSALPGALRGLAGSRVFFPRGDRALPEAVDGFVAAGATVRSVVAYRTVTIPLGRTVQEAIRCGVDAVTFTSPSTVHGFMASVGVEARTVLRRAVVGCIGPVTAAAVRAATGAEPVVASQATDASLVAALEGRFA